tara:strand:+ start:1384 stop:2034 length:651 start_codon:yes stop_codon:yes gene_type:complete
MTKIKICGIKTPDILKTCAGSGADFVGFVFYPPSPRYIDVDTAKELALQLPTGLRGVGLFVDPGDEELEHVLGHVPIDMIQLHGKETPQRVAEIKAKYHMPTIKAFPVREEADIEKVHQYEPYVDWLLFDAKPPNSDLPGGTGQSFDWNLLKGKSFDTPWMLSGGLTPENVVEALSVLSPSAVDVSSGVESTRGVKDVEKVKYFIKTVKNHTDTTK